MLCLSRALLVCTFTATALSAQTPSPTPPAQPSGPPGPPPTPCLTNPRNREFDFWVGTWDVYRMAVPQGQAPRIGVNVITVIEQGCALLESWTSRGGGTGRSLNWVDRNTRTWRQLWIDQQGGTLDYTKGEYRDGAMRFEGQTRNPQGGIVLQKLTFFNIHPDTVRQLFEASSDSGRTWSSSFDGRYVRRRTD